MTVLFQVDLLGGCRITHVATGVEASIRTRKAKCLLGIVLLSQNTSVNREKLASFLWDPAPEELARGSLRQSLKELRKSLGSQAEAALSADRFTVMADPSAFDVDVHRFLELLALGKTDREAMMRAAALWKGELFGSLLPDAPVFEAWVQVERSHLRTLLTKGLTDHLEVSFAAADYSDPHVAEELVRIEPSHELAHQYLMRFHAVRGDQSAALRQFTQMERALDDELDSEPSEDSIALLVAIKRGDIGLDRVLPAVAATAPATPKGPPRITFRPPLTRSEDRSKEYLGEGFAFLARTCLSRFRSWIVIPWPASGFEGGAAAGSPVDYTALGRAIDADFAIDSVLDWRGPRGKLFVSLIDCRDASEVWSHMYDIEELELQQLSASVVGAVAANLASQVNFISLRRYARNPFSVPAAHDLWLRAHQLSRMWKPEADAEAEELLGRAIEIDPALACAHASFAQILSTRSMVRPGYPARQADFAEAFKHARKAVALDPFDSRGHISLAWSWLISKSAERANSHFRLAVDLNPYDSETLIAAASGMAFLGHLEDALAWAELALELNPIHPEYYIGYLASIHFLNDDFATAIRTVDKCPDVFPHLEVWKAASFARLGDGNSAFAAYQSFHRLVREVWDGGVEPSDAMIETWLFETLPIHWPAGKSKLQVALRLARDMTGELELDFA